MTKTMLIDASHAEETRVVVLDGNRLDDFDIETADRKQIKGNIYLAKVIRVEPSLQAAFVEYGGNRHGFLAFAEIHPDYYQIPVADRQKLLEMEAEEARRRIEAEDAEDAREAESAGSRGTGSRGMGARAEAAALEIGSAELVTEIAIEEAPPPETGAAQGGERIESEAEPEHVPGATAEAEPVAETVEIHEADPESVDESAGETAGESAGEVAAGMAPAEPPEHVGGEDAADEARERRRVRALRSYKIQEVIHRRQIILVQVVKEERGSKGAALTTYISLAGRFSVLMPNSPNGGGVSRKITSAADRRRLKEAVAELDIPEGMGMIVRTAGANRPKPEIKRDCEYLLRLWDDIRERTLASVAPTLVYEEATLIKRTIRDVYTRDVDTLLVEGEDGFRTAREFMRMLMPTHVKKVTQWQERQPLFARHNVEQMLDQMFQPVVQLRSGGYLVINQTEALVAIDVNSGRSTRERNIEDTALRTNLEAAEEVARQLRLRDLAGLVVVDFIDMESRKHNGMVERKLKDALKTDRARIQVGSISHFGLLEMSRQRLRPSLAETVLIPCPHCAGQGHVRSTAGTALAVLRAIEDEAARQAAEIAVHLAPDVALYIFNHKRTQLAAIEARFAMQVRFVADGAIPSEFRLEKLKAQTAQPRPADAPVAMGAPASMPAAEQAGDEAVEDEENAAETGEARGESRGEDARGEDGERRRRRRRRRRGGRREDAAPAPGADQPDVPEIPAEFAARLEHPAMARPEPTVETGIAVETPEPAEPAVQGIESIETVPVEPAEVTLEAEKPEEVAKPKRRTRSPVRRRRAGADAEAQPAPEPVLPVFTDIADIFEAAEQVEARTPKPRRAPRKAAAAASAAPASESVPEPAAAPTPEIVSTPEAVPAPEPGPAVAAKAEGRPEPAPEAPEQPVEPVAAPAVQPMVIGSDDTPQAERKRGWWRRPA